jgi:glycosyltransferase involved in cell wall biosynthesis
MVTRLFSGLAPCLESKRWEPRGAPAIYRLIDALDRDGSLSLVLTEKLESGRAEDATISLSGLRAPVVVLGGPAALPRWLGRLRSYLAELRQLWKVARRARGLQPDLIYVDRGNLWIAGFFARWKRTPVIYRVMGISPGMRSAYHGRRPSDFLHRWLLRSPFALAICTEDGSGGEQWLERMLDPAVRRLVVVNGVDLVLANQDAHESEVRIPTDRTTVLFAGRLEEIKGAEEFMLAFLLARARARPASVHAVVMGDGPLMTAMQSQVQAAGAGSDVTFLGSVPHGRVPAVYRQCDVYVTLNRMGSLSNTTLEALAAGCCVVLPRGDPDTFRDLTVDRMLPDGAAVRIASVDDVEALADEILDLHVDRGRRQRTATRGAAAAKSFLRSWDDRIAQEVGLLREVARRPSHLFRAETSNNATGPGNG